MDVNKSGGPAYPTLNGAMVDEHTFRFEGMTLFDYFFAASVISGQDPEDAVEDAALMIELRNEHLHGTTNDTEEQQD